MATELTRAVALLRGVNVGPNNRVAMAELRRVLAGLGYADVVTVRNSGNAVFAAAPAALEAASADIEDALLDELGVACSVIVRTASELVEALAADPLGAVANDPSRHLVGFLAAEPEPAAAHWLAALEVAPDEIRLVGRHVYLWVPTGVTNGPLSRLGWERALGVAVTSRNVSTVARLVELTSQ